MDMLAPKDEKDYDKIMRDSAALSPAQCTSAREAHIIGKAYEMHGAFSSSIPWYVQSFLLEPSDERFGMIAGVCLAAGNYETLQEYLALPQADTEGYYYNAARYELAFRTGASDEEQIAALERFLDIQYEASYMLRLTSLYLEAGRDKDAERLCKKVMRLFPDHTQASSYASDLRTAIKAGTGLEAVRQNPWVKDDVFMHLTFDLSKPVPAGNASAPAPEKTADPPKKDKKPKIAPIVENSMQGIIGIEALKIPLNDIVSLLQLEKRKSKAELTLQKNLRIFGPDGCGKTTAAFAACRALHSMGLIDDAIPFITDYDSLLCDSDEELHNSIQTLFQSAENKCILIENIHEFDDGNAYGVGLKILDQLTKAFAAANGAVMLIITGREQESQELLLKKRRFADLFMLEPVILGAYSIDELMQITDAIAAKSSFVLEENAKPLFRKKLENAAAQTDFAYARDIDGMLKSCIRNVANRLRDNRQPVRQPPETILHPTACSRHRHRISSRFPVLQRQLQHFRSTIMQRHSNASRRSRNRMSRMRSISSV